VRERCKRAVLLTRDEMKTNSCYAVQIKHGSMIPTVISGKYSLFLTETIGRDMPFSDKSCCALDCCGDTRRECRNSSVRQSAAMAQQ